MEPYAAYIQRHILDPLGINHSTFRQPLPDDLAPLMAKGYRRSDQLPLPFFVPVSAPTGGLSATGVRTSAALSARCSTAANSMAFASYQRHGWMR